MLLSMTGFGRAEAALAAVSGSRTRRLGALASVGRVAVEVRSVNHRFLEVEARLPEGLQAFEEAARRLVARQVRRGQVRVSVAIQWRTTQPPVVFQADLAERYLAQLRQLQQRLKLTGTLGLETILTLPQVMSLAEREHPSAQHWPQIEKTAVQAVAEMIRMRRREGAKLQKELLRLLRQMEQLTHQIRRRVPEFQKQAGIRLAERVEAALKETAPSLAENRQAIFAEATSLMQGSDVSEELARLDSHFEALKKTISGKRAAKAGQESASSAGRTMDFLAQELQREVNTLGTKLRDPGVLQNVVAMKGQIEKLREQAANIE